MVKGQSIMVIIPREKPVIENLNIYYLDIKKLFEHFQGEIGSGGVFFKSHSAEGAIFFDEDELLNGYFQEKDTILTGNTAIDQLIQAGSKHNYTVSIYRISQEEVYFWASLPSAEKIYKDLSTDFTDLSGLIKKMRSEKLTGYIDVLIGNGKESGLIFISNGEIGVTLILTAVHGSIVGNHLDARQRGGRLINLPRVDAIVVFAGRNDVVRAAIVDGVENAD